MGLKLHCSDAFFSKARLRPEQEDRALPLPGGQVWQGGSGEPVGSGCLTKSRGRLLTLLTVWRLAVPGQGAG